MIIRDDQLEALNKSKRDDFIERLMKHFAVEWPEDVEALAADYRPFVESAIDAADGYGLKTEDTVARFVNLWFVWGEAFEQEPEHDWARQILEDEVLDGHVKILQLTHQTTVRLEQEEANAGER